MSVQRACDCCSAPMGPYDAGTVPVVLRARGIEIVVQLVPRDGVMPNVRPECLKTMIAEAELVYPAKRQLPTAAKVGRVVDPAAAEDEADAQDLPVPLRAAAGA